MSKTDDTANSKPAFLDFLRPKRESVTEDEIKDMVAENIELQNIFADGVIIEVCRNDVFLLFVCRVLNGRKMMDVVVFRNNHNAAGMLSACSFYAFNSFC